MMPSHWRISRKKYRIRMKAFFFFVSLLFVGVRCQANNSESSKEVYLPEGESAHLNCSINESVLLSNQLILAWKRNGERLSHHTIQTNNRTIQLKFENISYQDHGTYICGVFNLTNKNINMLLRNVSVYVGDKPAKPDMPKCSAVGWPPHATMSWTVAESGVKTDVFMSFTSHTNYCIVATKKFFRRLPHCSQASTHSPQDFNCSVTEHIKEFLANHSHTTPFPLLCASIQTWNNFGGSFSKVQRWDIYDRFSLCAKPDEFQVVEAGPEGIEVSWKDSHLMDATRRFHYLLSLRRSSGNVEIQNKETEEKWKINATHKYNFTGLKCYTSYVLSVACTFGYGLGDSHWGQKSYIKVSTKGKVPSKPVLVERPYFREGQHLRLTFKLPDNRTWCGIPWIVVRYWKNITRPIIYQRNVTGSAINTITLQDLDRHSAYKFNVSICTDTGCADTDQVYTDPAEQLEDPTAELDKAEGNGKLIMTIVLSIAAVLFLALLALAGVLYHSRRPRRRVQRRRPLEDDFNDLDPSAPEGEISASPADSQVYDVYKHDE